MFSQMTRRQYDDVRAATEENVLDILQRTGISVLWRNNNNGGCKGVCERVPTEDMPALKVAGQCVNADGTCYDEVLLHQLGTRIDAMNGDALVVLHQLGSHGPTYFERYPAQSRAFSPTCDSNQIQQCSNEALVNTYDNTLVHTDRMLGRTIDLLQGYSDQRDVALIYVSDHGESLGERGMYLHGTPYFIAPREQTQVPMVMWFSPEFSRNAGVDLACLRGNALHRAHSHDNVFHSLLGLFGVNSTVYRRDLDVFAGCRASASPAVATSPAKERRRLMPVAARNVARYCAARANPGPHTPPPPGRRCTPAGWCAGCPGRPRWWWQARVGEAGAGADRARLTPHHARRLQRQADQVALGVGRGDMGDWRDRSDQGLLELGLRVFAVADHVEAVRNGVAFERLAVAGAARRIELVQVAVGGLVQVQVHQQVRLRSATQAISAAASSIWPPSRKLRLGSMASGFQRWMRS